MSQNLRSRIARIESEWDTTGDWRQFDHPRDMPDWALVAGLLWHYEQDSQLKDQPSVKEVRRLYDDGNIDSAFKALEHVVRARL